MNSARALVFILAMLPASSLAAEFEVRIAPSDVIYTNQNNRRIGINDIMVQTISVVNTSNESVTILVKSSANSCAGLAR